MFFYLFIAVNTHRCGKRIECSIHNTFAVNNQLTGVNNSIKFVLPNF